MIPRTHAQRRPRRRPFAMIRMTTTSMPMSISDPSPASVCPKGPFVGTRNVRMSMASTTSTLTNAISRCSRTVVRCRRSDRSTNEHEAHGQRVLEVGERAPEEERDDGESEEDHPRAHSPRRGQQTGGRRDARHGAARRTDVEGQRLGLRPRPRQEREEPQQEGAGEDGEQLTDAEIGQGHPRPATELEVGHPGEAHDREQVDDGVVHEEGAGDRRPPPPLEQGRQTVRDGLVERVRPRTDSTGPRTPRRRRGSPR